MDATKTGTLISKLRTEKGLTQTALAQELNISNRTVSKWENGDGLPDISLIVELAHILEVSTDELLAGELNATDAESEETTPDYPVFKAQDTDAVKFIDYVHLYKPYFKEQMPLWIRILLSVCFITIGVVFVQLSRPLEFYQIMAVALVIVIAPIFLLASEYIFAFISYKTIASLSNGKPQFFELEVSDKIYINQTNASYKHDLDTVTGFYEYDKYFVFRISKRFYVSVNKCSFTQGTPEEFSDYMRSLVVNKKPNAFLLFAKGILVGFMVIAALICAVIGRYTAIYNSRELTEKYINSHESQAVFEVFDNNLYLDYDDFSSMNEYQKNAYIVTDFYNEFEEGGFIQYLCNSSGGLATELDKSLRDVGLTELADCIAKEVKENNLDLEYYKGEVDYYEEYKKHNYEKIDDEILEVYYNSYIQNAVGDYIKQNAEYFVDE